jgi:flavin-dependent dehydrogenase
VARLCRGAAGGSRVRLDAEVVVAGGGPAGAATAARLAAAGVDVLVLERAAFPREKACAEFLSPGAVAALERLGLRDRVDGYGAWLEGMRIVAPAASFTLRYEDGRRALGIPRPVLDAIVLDGARAAGARVRERAQVTAALVERGRVCGVRVRGEGGREESVSSRVVVGADGARSRVAASLGLVRRRRWPRRLGLVARARLAAPDSVGLMAVGAGAYCGVAAVGAGETSVGMAVDERARRRGEPAAALFDRVVDDLPAVRDALAAAVRTTPIRGASPLAHGVARPAGPGYLLVGDATGFLDPFTGEGVFRALRGAELAAAAVQRELGGRGDPGGYAAARRAAFTAKDRACLALQAVLASRPLFEHCLRRAESRPRAARALAGVFGDYGPADAVFRPSVLAELLRP